LKSTTFRVKFLKVEITTFREAWLKGNPASHIILIQQLFQLCAKDQIATCQLPSSLFLFSLTTQTMTLSPLLYSILSLSFSLAFEISIHFSSTNGSQVWNHLTSPDHHIEPHLFQLCYRQDMWFAYFHSKPGNVSLFFVFTLATKNPEITSLTVWTHDDPRASTLSIPFSSMTDEWYPGGKPKY